MPARCRLMNGLRETVVVYDLSPGGCGLRLRAFHTAVGMRVLLKTDGLEALTGVIRWVKDRCCGVQFDQPLYAPVVEHLCSLHTPDGADAPGTARTRGLNSLY